MEIFTIFFTIATYMICFYCRRPEGSTSRAQTGSAADNALFRLIPGRFRAALPVNTYRYLFTAAFILITLAGIGARLWQLGDIPYGLNQDEASIGYDSFAIGSYGYDRNGFHLPVYPIGFGDGHGPLYTYLSVPAIRLLGLSIFSVRITNALLSCTALIFFYFLVKRLTQNRMTALIGYALAATAPVLITSGRWALDGCPPPSLFIIALYLYIRAIDSGKSWSYALSALFFGLICYSYGPTGIVVPIFLIISSIYLLIHKKITWPQLIMGVVLFILVLLPMLVMMGINLFDLPAVNSWISFPRFTVMRTSSVRGDNSFIDSLLYGFNRIIFQPGDLIWNMMPRFGTTYLFTAPLILFGIVALFRNIRGKKYQHLFLVAAYLTAGLLLCGFINPNVNRLSVVYPGILLLIVFAIQSVMKQSKVLVMVLCSFFIVSFAGFVHNYFGINYRQEFGTAFFYSFGDALEFAMAKTPGTIYVTEKDVEIPSVITLFYSKLPPERFYETVKYYDDTVEWREAMYFDRYRFGIPEEKDPRLVYVVHPDEAETFDPAVFACETFENYLVMYPR